MPETRRTPLVPALLLCVLVGVPASAENPPGLENLGFEDGAVGEAPPGGWHHPTERHGYRVATTDEDAAEGERSALIVYEGEEPPADDVFGNLMRSFDAAPYRGKRVRFGAMVRTRGQVFGDRAQLWLRVDRSDGRMGFFDNMHDRPIVGSKWARYEIEGVVARDAEWVNLGAMLMDDGRAWIDAVTFEVLGDVDEGHEPARPLTDRGLANLEAFTRLLGYVRFFHPSDAVAAADWDSFALAGVQAVEEVAGPEELARALEGVFRPLAPAVRVYPSGGPKPDLPPELLEPPAAGPSRVRAWRHSGVGLAEGSIYSSERVALGEPSANEPEAQEAASEPEPAPHPAERVFEADLGAGVSALVPMALYADADGTLPRPPGAARPPAPDKPEAFRPGGTDRTTRLAGVALAWPLFQHFYPYFDVVEVDWGAELARALRSAAEDRTGDDYVETLSRLVAALDDGHGGVYHQEAQGGKAVPLAWDWVEDRLVITGTGERAPEGLAPGDVVIEIDGVPVAEALARVEDRISAANSRSRRWVALRKLSFGKADPVELRLESADGEPRTISVCRCHPPGEWVGNEPRPEPRATLAAGIEYVDLTRVSEQELAGSWERLAAAQAVIFDVRGYPRVGTETLSHLIDEPVSSPQWHVPLVTRPDREGMEFERSGWDVEPMEPRIRGKVAFLTDAGAISYAETFLGIVEHYRLGEIVGSPTAGTNGNVNGFELPGGYQVRWTGMKVLKQDGSRHHGVGILPTVPAERTITGIRAGRDEVLERALEALGGPDA